MPPEEGAGSALPSLGVLYALPLPSPRGGVGEVHLRGHPAVLHDDVAGETQGRELAAAGEEPEIAHSPFTEAENITEVVRKMKVFAPEGA